MSKILNYFRCAHARSFCTLKKALPEYKWVGMCLVKICLHATYKILNV